MRPMASTSMSMTARSTVTSSGCARSSRRSIPSSVRSKPSMASVIDTATADREPAPEATAAPGHRSAGPADPPSRGPVPPSPPPQSRGEPRFRLNRLHHFRWRRVSPLTRRIIAVNVLPLALLAVGFLYLGKFEATLIGQQIESLHTQGEIFAAALSEGAVLDSTDEGEVLLPDLARQMIRRLVEPTRTRARLFDRAGTLVSDSRLLRGSGDAVQVAELPDAKHKDLLMRLADRVYDWFGNLLTGQHQ